MLLSKEVEVKWNGFTRKWYESKGYKFTKQHETFICKVDDLQNASTVEVDVECDYCKKAHKKEYRKFLHGKEIINKDCCKKCKNIKQQEIIMAVYGVSNILKLDSIKEKVGESKRTLFKTVQDAFEDKKLILLSKESEYKNDRSKLLFICSKHKDRGIQETTYANVKKNLYCCKYAKNEIIGEIKRLDGKIVYDKFISRGYEPQFEIEDYEANSQKLAYICPKHREKGVQYIQYGNLQQGQGCYYCGKDSMKEKMRDNEEDIFNYFISRGLAPIDGEKYINKEIHIKYTCNKHPNIIQQTTYDGLKRTKQPCDYCRVEESIFNLNRKLRSSLGKWRKASEKECSYKCILTGSNEYQIHHLVTYNDILKEALNNLDIEIKNHMLYNGEEIVKIKNEVLKLHDIYPKGVCLHRKLHELFHILYTKDSNNPEQIKEFKARYFNGEFDDSLECDIKSNNCIKKLKELNKDNVKEAM